MEIKFNLDKNIRYILACSNGPDSMALFNLLLVNKYDFIVCFVNYKTRKESDVEEDNITKICQQNFIILEKLTYNLSNQKSNFEVKAREIRNDFFVKIAKKYNINYVLKGHHLDDYIETILFKEQTNRISMFEGLSYKNYFKDGVYFIRPLLSYTKEELLNYCNENNVIYSIDYTNFLDLHTRNKIRNKIKDKYSKFDKFNTYLTTLKTDLNTSIGYKKISANYTPFIKNIEVLHGFSEKNSIQNQYFWLFNLLKIDPKSYKSERKNLIFNNDELKKINLTKPVIEFKDFNIWFYENFYIAEEKNKEFNYCFNVEESKKYLGFAGDFFKNKYPNTSLDAIEFKPLITSKYVLIDGHKKLSLRYLKDIHLPGCFRKIWPAIFDKDTGELIYFPRYDEKFNNNEQNIFNFKMIDFLLTFLSNM